MTPTNSGHAKTVVAAEFFTAAADSSTAAADSSTAVADSSTAVTEFRTAVAAEDPQTSIARVQATARKEEDI